MFEDISHNSTRKLTKGEKYWLNTSDNKMQPFSASPYQPIPGYVLVMVNKAGKLVACTDPLDTPPKSIDGARQNTGGTALNFDFRRPKPERLRQVSNPDALDDHEVQAKAAGRKPSAGG